MNLFDRNPTPGAYAAKPLSILEIDNHPDADRIWATLMAIRADVNKRIKKIENETERVSLNKLNDAYQQGYDTGYADAEEDAA